MAIQYIEGIEEASGKKYSLVYLATHEGELRLPFMNRSFISFTFGGKYIEDFDLIATITGDKLNRKGYADFNDTVTMYDNLDGLHYWATHYKANQMDFTLSTDGIDQKTLDNFLHWFKAGACRELVLSEHPNRGIMARVASAPLLDLLPFEGEVEIKLYGTAYKTKTTLYKGDILLSFVMDKPHWYALKNVLGEKEGNYFVDKWIDVKTGRVVMILDSLDALKILYEDGIPLGSMIMDSMLLGNGAFANAGDDPVSCIYDEDLDYGARICGVITGNENPPSAFPPGEYFGYIAGAAVDISGDGILSLSAGTPGYFFYSGTAPAPTLIRFTLLPCLKNNYIALPSNSYAQYSEGYKHYNTITIQCLTKLTLRFTTPNVFTSYNKAISLFEKYAAAATPPTWEDLRDAIRDQVRHARVREWAVKCIDYELSLLGLNPPLTVASTYITTMLIHMLQFLKDDTGELYPVKFSFNSETGEALGEFKYRIANNAVINDWQYYGLPANNNPVAVEDVGDMLLSNYIVLLDRNYPTEDGYVIKWENINDTTRLYSYKISHDIGYGVPEIIQHGELTNYPGILNLQVLYKNMYL